MLKINNEKIKINKFPDKTLLLKYDTEAEEVYVEWFFENNEELVALIFLTRHLRELGVKHIELALPYIPNARQDRVKNNEDVFTLKYFCEIINSLNFDKVYVLDPHSFVSEALINNISISTPINLITKVFEDIDIPKEDMLIFYPDEGAMKRYSGLIEMPYAFGIKKRNWATGEIQGLDVAGAIEDIKDKNILIIDDICSKGGTFYHSAKKLKELGAKDIFLCVSHCENTIKEGELLTTNLIKKIYTTDSIYTEENEKVKVFSL